MIVIRQVDEVVEEAMVGVVVSDVCLFVFSFLLLPFLIIKCNVINWIECYFFLIWLGDGGPGGNGAPGKFIKTFILSVFKLYFLKYEKIGQPGGRGGDAGAGGHVLISAIDTVLN